MTTRYKMTTQELESFQAGVRRTVDNALMLVESLDEEINPGIEPDEMTMVEVKLTLEALVGCVFQLACAVRTLTEEMDDNRPSAIGVGNAPRSCIIADGHIYEAEHIAKAKEELRKKGLPDSLSQLISLLHTMFGGDNNKLPGCE